MRPEGSPETKDPEVINAYDSAGQVRTYFKQVLNRDSIDNRALDLVLNVHFGVNFNNAFWDGDEMTFGDGDGVDLLRLRPVARRRRPRARPRRDAVRLGTGLPGRVGGPERALQRRLRHRHHPVGQRGEPRERRLADRRRDHGTRPLRRGAAVDAGPGTAYDNPIIGKDPQPAHYDNRYTGSGDNGGVHINSGIPNRAFYLAATELGDTLVAARIWYHSLHFMKPNSTFAQAAAQVADSARDPGQGRCGAEGRGPGRPRGMAGRGRRLTGVSSAGAVLPGTAHPPRSRRTAPG